LLSVRFRRNLRLCAERRRCRRGRPKQVTLFRQWTFHRQTCSWPALSKRHRHRPRLPPKAASRGRRRLMSLRPKFSPLRGLVRESPCEGSRQPRRQSSRWPGRLRKSRPPLYRLVQRSGPVGREIRHPPQLLFLSHRRNLCAYAGRFRASLGGQPGLGPPPPRGGWSIPAWWPAESIAGRACQTRPATAGDRRLAVFSRPPHLAPFADTELISPYRHDCRLGQHEVVPF